MKSEKDRRVKNQSRNEVKLEATASANTQADIPSASAERSRRLAWLKQSIEAGTYDVPSAFLADKLIGCMVQRR